MQRKILIALRGASIGLLFGCGAALAEQGPTLDELSARYAPQAYLAQQKHGLVRVMTVGDGAQRAYAFIPDAPRPSGAPVVLFHHGWLGVNPKNFGALIDQLVRIGAVVIFPVYQDIPNTQPREITDLAAMAERDTLAAVERAYPGLMNRDKTLYYGFSMGAAISLNLALAPEKYELPPPRALAIMAPGNAHHVAKGPEAASIIGDISKLPPDIALAMVAGTADASIGLPTARKLAGEVCHLPKDSRTLLIFPSDESGSSHVNAVHGSAGAPDSRYDFPDTRAQVTNHIPARSGFEDSVSLNTLDFAGYWKVVIGLLEWVDKGRYPDDVFGDNAAVRFLGKWPNGTPYKSALVEDPCAKRD